MVDVLDCSAYSAAYYRLGSPPFHHGRDIGLDGCEISCQFGRDFGTEYGSIDQLLDIYIIKINRLGRAPLSYRRKQIQAIPN